MIKGANIEFVELEDETFDDPMGEATGAAAIFGVTGGVAEAALRSVSGTKHFMWGFTTRREN